MLTTPAWPFVGSSGRSPSDDLRYGIQDQPGRLDKTNPASIFHRSSALSGPNYGVGENTQGFERSQTSQVHRTCESVEVRFAGILGPYGPYRQEGGLGPTTFLPPDTNCYKDYRDWVLIVSREHPPNPQRESGRHCGS